MNIGIIYLIVQVYNRSKMASATEVAQATCCEPVNEPASAPVKKERKPHVMTPKRVESLKKATATRIENAKKKREEKAALKGQQ